MARTCSWRSSSSAIGRVSGAGPAAGVEAAGAGDGSLSRGALADRRFDVETLGAMSALETFFDWHSGHSTKPRLRCLSKESPLGNQLSNSWSWSQTREYLIMNVPYQAASIGSSFPALSSS